MKMKGVRPPVESSPYDAVYEDSRTRFKHQSLMQDYEELRKETEVKRKKLQIMKQKRLTLMAEVRFLRRRYKYLMQNQSSKTAPAKKFLQLQNVEIRAKSIKERKFNGKEAGLPPPVPRFSLNQKGKVSNEAQRCMPAPNFDSNQRQRIYGGNETSRNFMAIPDLNQAERLYNTKETSVRSIAPIFDLNQISREEEELQARGETSIVEDVKNSSMRSGGDELLNDMMLSVCRDIGNGSKRVGKRKISWQDQVALRV